MSPLCHKVTHVPLASRFLGGAGATIVARAVAFHRLHRIKVFHQEGAATTSGTAILLHGFQFA